MKLRLAMLISGGGTTMREILRACQDGRLPRIEPALVIASTPEAGGIEKAIAEGCDQIIVLNPKEPRFGEIITYECRQRGIDLIGQYGWLPKTPTEVIEAFRDMMINQHPGPLDPGRPDFGGKGMYGSRVHCARLYFLRAAGRPIEDMWTAATAQRVALNYDQGAVLRTRVVRIEANDDVASLQQRVLPEEHQVQIETLRDFSEGTVNEMPPRDKPLVFDNEIPILEEAKHVAATLFPKG